MIASSALVSIDFENPNDFADNFRSTYNPTETATTQGSGYVSTNAISLSSGTTLSETYIYDPSPSSAVEQSVFGGPITISFDIRAAQGGSSFGIYIVNPTETAGVSGNRLALFNLGTGATDRIRIFSTSSISNASVGTATYDSAATLSIADPGSAFFRASLAYSQGINNSAVLNYTVNGVSSGDINLGDNSYQPNFEVGIRLFDGSVGGGTADFDNFEIVPEPSSLAFAGLASLGLAARRRRG